jgi:hypothetical protein
MADASRHRRWLSGLVTRRAQDGKDAASSPDGRDPLVTYYSDLRRIADDDVRSRRPLAK